MASYDGETWRYYDDAFGAAPSAASAVLWDVSGNIKVYHNNTVYSYSFTENRWREYATIGAPDYQYIMIMGAMIDNNGTEICVLTRGIYEIENGAGKYTYLSGYQQWGGLSISSFLVDSAGNLWFGNGNNASIKRIGSVHLAVEKSPDHPESYVLDPVYPNPFNSTTTIRYSLGEKTTVALTIYSMTGQKVCVLVNETQHAGMYSVQWDGTIQNCGRAASGVYFASLSVAGIASVQKMLLLK